MMINNIHINRLAVLVLMLCICAAGYDTAKQEAAQAHHNHPANHQPLRP
jgi:hypothetical protein